MGTPITFPERNTTWQGWEADGDRPHVWDLPAHRYQESTITVTISCWRLTWWERLCAVFTGRVWLHVWGDGHPPVAVDGRCPFPRRWWRRR